jgi:hypothetical protein
VADDLVLSVHLDVLERNLQAVAEVLQKVEALSVGQAPPVGQTDLDTVLRWARKAEGGLKDDRSDDFDLGDRDDEGDPRLPEELLLYVVNRLEKLLKPFREPLLIEGVLPVEHDDLSIDLAGFAAKLAGDVATLRGRLDNGEPEADLWPSYRELEGRSRDLFNEYVDLVRGVALRALGFDRDLCRVADSIVREIGANFRWKSISIPSRVEYQRMSTGALIRLGFPDWTVWALPLVAHAFGHVVAERDKDLRADLAKRSDVERTLVIDAFATTVMGPAFACAALLVRFDPAAIEAAGDLQAKRVATILDVLDDSERGSGPVKGIVKTLRGAWEVAVQESGGVPLGPSELPAGAKALVRAASYGVDFPADEWAGSVEPWAKDLRNGNVAAIQPKEYAGIRHLLNAAWRCRVAPEGEPSGSVVTDRQALRKISEQVHDLCTTWAKTPRLGGKQGGGGQGTRGGGHQ